MRVGLLMVGDYNWAGGLYYVLNIIRLFKLKENQTQKIRLVIFYNKSTPSEILDELKMYPVELVDMDKHSLIYKVYCKLIYSLIKINIRFINEINNQKVDYLFPLTDYLPEQNRISSKIIYWLYDFQHFFLPQLFSPQEIVRRNLSFQNIAHQGHRIVVSSQDSLNSFHNFFPSSKARVHVYEFVSIIDKSGLTPSIGTAYNLTGKYFLVSNQFWQHKNHIVILKAIQLLVQKGLKTKVVFTGSQNDHRNKSYFTELKKFIDQNKLNDYILFTGFISRENQLALMDDSLAVIQPSLFEGWSTVVEDAKALSKPILASNLAVHHEQIKMNGLFFEPADFQTLAGHMSTLLSSGFTSADTNYGQYLNVSFNTLLDIFKE